MDEYGTMKKVGLILGPALFLLLLAMTPPEGMQPEAMKVAAVTVLMAVWWITEAVPIPAASLLPIILYPALGIMKSAAATAPYANPTIYLFIGGFFVAVAMEKWNLHKRIALYTIRAVGASPSLMTLGFMISVGFMSMWVSNTACAMMMIPIGLAVVTQVTGKTSADILSGSTSKFEMNFAKGLMLGIAYAASLGGVATLIGTPPNTIMVGMMDSMYGVKITFAQWLIIGVPMAIVMLAFTWLLLTKIMFPTGDLKLSGGRHIIQQEIERLGPMNKGEKMVMGVFVFVATAWIAGSFVKISYVDDTTIAILGTLIMFLLPVNLKKGEFVLDWKTAVKIPWDIVLLFGGGFAIANGFAKTGLANWISTQLTSLETLGILGFVTIVTLLVIFLTEVTSNTATATLMVPIMGSAAVALGVHPFATIISACVAASFAFMLPCATPPNAIVFSSGAIRIVDMVKAGLWLNFVGAAVIIVFVVYVLPIFWGVDLNVVPQWAIGK
ncbi:MAG: DASS family sodium-coupled anion symporter [Deferribacterales bacterium]|nr:DASS family sodium-coupled anion symporter [Deferribacterales bacterium]